MIKPESLTSLSMCFPCYNEEDNIGSMIEQAVAVGESYGVDYEILVVDDGSEDRSAEIVRGWSRKNSRVKLVCHDTNIGYGATVRACLRAASKDIVFITDSDNQYRLIDIEKLFSRLDSCDAVVGYRINRQEKLLRRLNGSLWTQINNFLFGLRIRDIDCAFKLFRRTALEGLELKSDQLFIFAETLAKLRKKGCRIEEIGISHYPRTAGKATATGITRILKTFEELVRLYGQIKS